MKTKSTPKSLTLGSVMWEIVLFDYMAKPASIPSERSFGVDGGVWRPSPSLDR